MLVLYGFQLVFLPYHDARITWIHRALIVLDVFIILTLWPLIRNGGRNCGWTLSRVEISVFVSVVVVSSVVAMMLHFPGEKFVRIFFVEGAKFDEAEICSASILARYDRLSLRNVDIV
ncbi:hypothetical protein D4Q71_14475 [Rhodopseudomonas palustris]|nr:hypothetical protein B1S06_08970 [Rhodopseudomonas palustris]RJF63713.1 hypothetical protein D4Q71_14475 [Rhodopseudomonas palustris]